MASGAAGRVATQIEERRRPFQLLVDGLSLDEFEATTRAGWSVKELLSHIAFWDEAVFGFMTMVLRGKPLPEGWTFGSGYVPIDGVPWPHFETHNAREAEWGRQQTAETVRGRLAAAHTVMLDAISTVSELEWETHQEYYESLGNHYLEHASELEAIAAK